MTSRRRALVSGAGGFVGANLVRRLLGDGHQVHVLLRPGGDRWRLLDVAADINVYEVDLEDPQGVRGALRDITPEWVFHTAAHGAYPRQLDWRRMLALNVVATACLLEGCVESGFEAFVNTGSSSEYGFKNHAPAEAEALEPNSHYAVTKASGTLFCSFTGRVRGLPISTLRLYSVYGPYEEPTRLVPTLLTHGLDGRLPPLADPATARDYVHVDDVVDAYLAIAQAQGLEPGAVFNVGTGVQVSLQQAVETARQVLGVESRPVWGSMPGRSWDTAVWVSDSSRLRERLGWSPRHDFESGLRSTAAWMLAEPQRLEWYRARQAQGASGPGS